ncbi:glucan phosphoethanolaminetransferase (alkaline phosphatase superfamily) [Cytobacillus horneckiae]|uniref:Uncharacterized protein n=1 Tax=Cytobacillus horneckiae TaxID=549687 RepID=A0A2N0ZFL5_9BACI|nr:hypothetical protein [Cytobacillus horneckiae]MBN6885161.1 hypothetical protein [Cytobacillus horneckiae]MCM3179088.1 hypothetical protein [Cytobacillus horneckiae]MEC1154312.1 hypothetical protein [Cytobacillus horneckiae]MED2937648.1 hypothetical protein [Cytobacillus horneckiae]PKG28296.1 hypothetical protein CWS20_13885 [Cytobacillus horneckiae]
MAEIGMNNRINFMQKKITAVDLITIVIFAVLYRVLWYFFKFAGVVFPFNHTFVYLFCAFCLVLCWVVVRRPYASVYFTAAWCAINFFLQGELPIYWILVVTAPLLPELYLQKRSKSFSNPDEVYSSTKDLIVAALLYNIVYEAFVWWSIIYPYQIPVPFNLMAIVFGISLIGMIIGTVIAKPLGLKLKNLLG